MRLVCYESGRTSAPSRHAPTARSFRFGENMVQNLPPVLGCGQGVGRAMGDLRVEVRGGRKTLA